VDGRGFLALGFKSKHSFQMAGGGDFMPQWLEQFAENLQVEGLYKTHACVC